MPDQTGRFKGISVPRIPWHEHPEPRVGEVYGISVYDDGLYVRFEVTDVTDETIAGRDVDDGGPVVVGRKRMARADRL